MLPQVNARLLTIQSDGTSEDWDEAEGAGTPKWSGDTDAYVLEKIRTVFSPNDGALIKFRDVNLLIPSTLRTSDGDPLVVDTGDIVTWRKQNLTHTRRVMDYTAADMLSVPTVMMYVRLHLEPERIEL